MIVSPACFQQTILLQPFTKESLHQWLPPCPDDHDTIIQAVNQIFQTCQKLYIRGVNCCMFSHTDPSKVDRWAHREVDNFIRTPAKWPQPNTIQSICKNVFEITTRQWCHAHRERNHWDAKACDNVYLLEWTQENRALLPVPTMRLDLHANESHFARFKKLINNPKDSDVCFEIRDQTIFGHKLFLKQNPFFERMFEGGFKETTHNHIEELQQLLQTGCRVETVASQPALIKQEYDGRPLKEDITTIAIKEIEPHIFIHLLEYIYTGTVAPEALATVDSTLALFMAADYIEEPSLKKLCVKELYKLCSKDTYVTIAYFQLQATTPDDDLERLCRWVPRYFQTIFDEIDIEISCPITLIILSLIIEKYNPFENKRKELYEKIFKVLKPQLQLDEDFTFFCKAILNYHLKECWTHLLLKILSEREALFNELKSSQSTACWRAYEKVSVSAPILRP